MTLPKFIKSIGKQWRWLSQGAAVIGSTIFGFIYYPVENDGTKNLAIFIIAILVAIFFLIAHRLSKKKHAWIWVLVTVLTLGLTIFAVRHYSNTRARVTCVYLEETRVIGTVLTEQGKKHVSENPGIGCDQLLFNFAGVTEDIWTTDSINDSRALYSMTYLQSVTIAALCILSALQILRSTTSRR